MNDRHIPLLPGSPTVYEAVTAVMKQVPFGAILSETEIADDLVEMGFARSQVDPREIRRCLETLVDNGKPVRRHSYTLWERLLAGK